MTEPVDSTRWPGFFQRVVARRLRRTVADSVQNTDASKLPMTPVDWAGHLSEGVAEEVGRIVVDQLLELAETLNEPGDLDATELAVDSARLIDPVYTAQHWDETKEARR